MRTVSEAVESTSEPLVVSPFVVAELDYIVLTRHGSRPRLWFSMNCPRDPGNWRRSTSPGSRPRRRSSSSTPTYRSASPTPRTSFSRMRIKPGRSRLWIAGTSAFFGSRTEPRLLLCRGDALTRRWPHHYSDVCGIHRRRRWRTAGGRRFRVTGRGAGTRYGRRSKRLGCAGPGTARRSAAAAVRPAWFRESTGAGRRGVLPFDDLIAVLDAQGIDRTVLVGVSMGGAIVVNTALNHP